MNKYIFVGFLVISSFCCVSATSIIPPPTSTATDGNGVVVDTVEDTIDCASITHSLKLGSRDTTTGGDVTTLQTFLSQANYLESDPTGYFGRATKKAVQDFQKANGIEPLGNVGPYTRAKIKLISCKTTAISPTTKNTYQGGYSYTNLLKEVKILDPVWSIPEDGAGTVSVSISNLPKDNSIDNYSLSIYCNGLSLLRNGVDLCSAPKDIKNLYTGSLNYDFAYKIQGETQNGVRGVTILLSANNSSNKVVGSLYKVSYQQKATPKQMTVTDGSGAVSPSFPVNTNPPLQIDEASQTKLLLEVLEPMDQVTTMVGIGGGVVEGPIDNEAKISFAIGYYSPSYYLEIEPEISVSPTEGNPGYTVNINNFGYEQYLNGSVTPFGAGGHSKYKVTGSTGTLFVSRNTNDRRPLYLIMRVIDPTTNLIKATQKIAVTAKK